MVREEEAYFFELFSLAGAAEVQRVSSRGWTVGEQPETYYHQKCPIIAPTTRSSDDKQYVDKSRFFSLYQ